VCFLHFGVSILDFDVGNCYGGDMRPQLRIFPEGDELREKREKIEGLV